MSAPPERNSWPAGHVIHMSLEALQGEEMSLAKCDCGWDYRCPWRNDQARAMQDAAIEAHWQEAEKSDVRLSQSEI